MHLTFFFLQFKFKHGEPRARSLKDLGWEKSPFSRKFKNAHAGSDFMAIWEKDVAPNLNAITGAFNKDPDAVAIADTDIALPKAKRPKEDKGTGKLDREIDAAYLGLFLTIILTPLCVQGNQLALITNLLSSFVQQFPLQGALRSQCLA